MAPAAQTFAHAPQLRLLVDVSTQVVAPPAPGHAVCPVAQPGWQAPFTHSLPGPQRIPHPPQSTGSLDGSTHSEPHRVVPAEQVHSPATHEAPAGQVVPHAPQSKGLLVRSTHAFAQSVLPFAHSVVQTPAEQTLPGVHISPQTPQLAGSLSVSVQTPLQRWPPSKHMQEPAWQEVPALQSTPQEPQFALSVSWSTQDEPHAESPAVHVTEHWPPMHA